MTHAPASGTPWHALDAEACLERLAVTREGLSPAGVQRRRQQYGANRLVLPPGRSSWRILLDQFLNVMLLLLLGVAAVSVGLALWEGAFPRDAIAILLIVALTALMGYLQESRAQQSLQALLRMVQPLARVRREGGWQRLASEELVPGDLIRLEAGDRVPADARLLEAADLGVQEAVLTGEAEPVLKQAGPPLPPATALGERATCLHMGTDVVRGRGLAVVTDTGMATVIGGIAELIRSADKDTTPLQRRLESLSRQLVAWALLLVALVLAVGIPLGQPPLDLLQLSLSTAVAVVPEGLPAVITVTLAIGTRRMVKRAALIRRLPAVEALGSITVICTDKTGTLTRNRMTVAELRCGTRALRGDGGWTPNGSGALDLPPPPGARPGCVAGGWQLLLQAGALCNDADLRRRPAGGWDGLGDPTEVALLLAAEEAGIDTAELRRHHPRTAELPFSSARRWMAVGLEDRDGSLSGTLGLGAGSGPGPAGLLLAKGAPEPILQRCEHWLDGSGVRPLDRAQRDWWKRQCRELAADGLRLLAFAGGPHRHDPLPPLVLLGLMAERDPARPEVAAAVARCHAAGIRPVMITGDHPLTARSIARGIGMERQPGGVVLGERLDGLDDEALGRLAARSSIYARVTPEQKLRIVKALQAAGEVVAMTGDGVNDAPALRQSHIGVAMGCSGSDVSRDAADVVLLDDNFATIVNAVEEGRLVYANIRRFVRYILGCNLGELITISSAPLLGLGLTPLQILWINLVTDGLPALALALAPPEEELMQNPPIAPAESIFARGIGAAILRTGLLLGALVVGMMLLAQRQGRPWTSMAFTTLCLAQLGHALAAGSDRPLLRRGSLAANPWLLAAVLGTGALQLALLYTPPLARFFEIRPLSPADLGLCLVTSGCFLLLLEADKLLSRRLGRRQAPAAAAEPD